MASLQTANEHSRHGAKEVPGHFGTMAASPWDYADVAAYGHVHNRSDNSAHPRSTFNNELNAENRAKRSSDRYLVQMRRGGGWEIFVIKEFTLAEARSLAMFLNETDTGWYRAKKVKP